MENGSLLHPTSHSLDHAGKSLTRLGDRGRLKSPASLQRESEHDGRLTYHLFLQVPPTNLDDVPAHKVTNDSVYPPGLLSKGPNHTFTTCFLY